MKTETETETEGQKPILLLAGCRVLVADDNPDNQFLMVECLSGAGAVVEAVSDGKTALERIRDASPAFDMALLDLEMPGMDGAALTQQLRQRGVAMPIVICSAHNTEADRAACFRAGADEFLPKPIHFDEVIATVRTYCPLAGAAQPVAIGRAPSVAASQPLAGGERTIDLEPALERVGHNVQVFKHMAGQFMDGHADTLAALRAHLGAGDLKATASLLHTLRGSALALGALDLAEFARQAESRTQAEAAQAQAPLSETDLPPWMDELQALSEQAATRLQEIVASLAQPGGG